VNADIGTIETIFVPETDSLVNPLGIKGIGELGTVGLNAGVANTVFHATGVRIRELPVRIEKLLVDWHNLTVRGRSKRLPTRTDPQPPSRPTGPFAGRHRAAIW
jgi:hypothetical protein